MKVIDLTREEERSLPPSFLLPPQNKKRARESSKPLEAKTRKKPKKPSAAILFPQRSTSDAKSFVWDAFEARDTKSPAGYGLFAKRNIPRCTFLPYLGNVIELNNNTPGITYDDLMGILETRKSNKRLYLRNRMEKSRTRWVDAYREDSPLENIGIHGLGAAGLINEPPRGTPPNVGSVSNYYVTLRDIQPGEQLLGCYGSGYVRPGEYAHTVNPVCTGLRQPGLPKNCTLPKIGLATLLSKHNIQEPRFSTPESIRHWASTS